MTKPLFFLTDTEGSGDREPAGLPVIDSRNRIFTGSANTSGVVLVWDTDGNFLSSFGRHGDGPGEMTGLAAVLIGVGDSIHVRDNRQIWSVFDPQFRFVRRVQGSFGPDGFNALLPSGEVVSGFGTSRQVLVHNRDGTVIAEFGTDMTEIGDSPPVLRVAASSAPDRFWSVDWRRPHIRLWSVEAGLVSDMGEPVGTAFPPEEEVMVPTHDEPVFEPGIADLREIDELLWYQAILPTTTSVGPLESSREVDDSFDHLIEVVDPNTGRTVAATLSPDIRGSFSGFVNDTLAWRWTTDRFGVPTYEFVRFGLIRAPLQR